MGSVPVSREAVSGNGAVMTRLIAIATVLLLGAGQLPALAAPAVVDLDAPGALEAVARDNPVHYEKIRRIVAGVNSKPDSHVFEWLRVGFGATDIQYVPLIMVSYPPKRRLSFSLDGTRYVTVITLDVRPKVTPAR